MHVCMVGVFSILFKFQIIYQPLESRQRRGLFREVLAPPSNWLVSSLRMMVRQRDTITATVTGVIVPQNVTVLDVLLRMPL